MEKLLKIKLNGQEITIQQAKELWEELNLIFKEKQTEYIPYQPYTPYPPYHRDELFKVWY